MNKIKDILYIIVVNSLIIFFMLTIATNIVELLNPIYKAMIDMILGVIAYFVCKDITEILIKEVKECTTRFEKKK
jgi:hypothetical protein